MLLKEGVFNQNIAIFFAEYCFQKKPGKGIND